ncbi:shikimate dehydrogenase [Mesorhizobium sp. RP14(2022)]|uniref:shikimate dehydrogenase (NADP(+)) n=1 Tax=Mesorhizobium liriopis TaxID=2953882 RepID=A0ABT1CBR9_9HYPH|nr:shikimate dehydrogenase [Mesorhizobium liriopis]MCO6052277.1 shikimate dehydrogenase [Mesorhizobium liriopis]
MADHTTIYGLIGHPIASAQSPAMLNTYLLEHSLPGRMVAFDISPDGLETSLSGLRQVGNLLGFFVTMPFKESILHLLDEVSKAAHIAGAVNIVRRLPDGRLIGHQLDGAGFVGAMEKAGIAVAGKIVHMAGAGGVAAGIAYALARAGVARITLTNRSRSRAEVLAARLGPSFPQTAFTVTDMPPGRDVDILVNATTLGLQLRDPLPFDLSGTRGGIFVGDVVNGALTTPLLVHAAACGCKVQAGMDMFPPQIPLALDFFERGL